MSQVLDFLSAGAAQGLLKALQPRFEASQGLVLKGRFGAVGAMKEALLGGEPCDLFGPAARGWHRPAGPVRPGRPPWRRC